MRDLRRLANSFATKAVGYEAQFTAARDFRLQAFATISLYASWEEFSRKLLYSSAYCLPWAGGGRRIARAPGISTIRDVEGKLREMKRVKPQYRLIVHLGGPSQMVQACRYLQVANQQVVAPAITSQNSPADSLRIVRNFLAHQNPDTAGQLKLGPRYPDLELSTAIRWLGEVQAGGRTRFGVWVSDLSDVARACVQ